MWIWLASATGLLLLGRRHRLLASPIDGPIRTTPHGHFGARRDGPPPHAHQGVDIEALPGAVVRASGNGVVVATKPGLGKTVRKLVLDPPGTWAVGGRGVAAIVYADLGEALVDAGDRVRRGDPVALVGSAGFFHFAIKARVGGAEVFIDPGEAGLEYRPNGPEVS